MKRIFSLICIFSCVLSSAQNLTPTVRITNSYKTGSVEGDRVSIPVTVPDSLGRFDYKFDYKVFNTPYKGAYEFRPYSVNFAPEPETSDERSFWLRAGAGYSLHPELQAVWNPVRKPGLKVNVHQDLYGYLGDYRSMANTVLNKLDENSLLTIKDHFFQGYDLSETFGADAKWVHNDAAFSFGADYRGIFAKDNFLTSHFNAMRLRAGYVTPEKSKVHFKLGVKFDVSGDNYPDLNVIDRTVFRENRFVADGDVAPSISDNFSLNVGYTFFYAGYSSRGTGWADNTFGFSARPVLGFHNDALRLDVGADICYAGSGVKVAPLLDFSILLLDRRMDVYARSTGGYEFTTYSSLKETDHWLNAGYCNGVSQKYDYFNVSAGVRGSLFSRLQYDVNVGYAMTADMPLYTFRLKGYRLSPALGFAACNVFSASARLAWRSESFDADASLLYRHTSLGNSSSYLNLPAFTGNARALYNYRHRIFGGVRMECATSRGISFGSTRMNVPAYIDLGLYGEYRMTAKLAFWLQVANLLNQPVQRVPMHVEQGISATVGIRLDLQ